MAMEMSLASRLKQAQEYEEGPLDRAIEAIDAEPTRLPSDTFLWSALGVLGLSLALFNAGKKADAMFVGQLATPILALGLYRKLVSRATESDPFHS